jgi:NADH-quinone oxidoreductase subunit C
MSAIVERLVASCDGLSTPGFGPETVDVDPGQWLVALGVARGSGATWFDLLAAYDDGAAGIAVLVHLSTPDARDHLLVRTHVPREAASLPSATSVYPGAAWHEREAHELLGVEFAGHPDPRPLLLHSAAVAPLRKDVLLDARLQTPWPGEKEPGESDGRARRRLLPPGVPADPPGGPT